jgi:hypothetical protein
MFTGHLNDKKTFFNQLKSHRKESLYRNNIDLSFSSN